MSFKTTIIEPRMVKKPPFTVEVSGCPQIEGETLPRRNVRTPDRLLAQPEEGISTLYDLVKHSASKFGDHKALGSRTLIKRHHETKKVKKLVNGELQHVDKSWTYFELSEYKYLSYAEYETLTLQIGAGLRKLGLSAPDRVHMFASTRYNSLNLFCQNLIYQVHTGSPLHMAHYLNPSQLSQRMILWAKKDSSIP
jgi:long-chain acyl-CoA synthetase